MTSKQFVDETSIALAMAQMAGESVRQLSDEACTEAHINALIEANRAATRLMMALNEIKVLNALAMSQHPPPS